MILRICDRGDNCPQRNIPLVDVFLTKSGATWLQRIAVSVQFATEIADWCKSVGVTVEHEEASTDPEHQRDLFSDVE